MELFLKLVIKNELGKNVIDYVMIETVILFFGLSGLKNNPKSTLEQTIE